ncbi:ATP-grasp fold [Syntrophomonas zehnderi OL-4]|uniref:ATP-grasp fold n=1 Tax=Syntrophomonas zehnderi OL-4 TaxID=690567 RepID=A0A0E3W2W3_9FIRM|nr:biotin carboxylase N-terminal domain-containing protein [Syntrophomonas zehnderi]CFX26532.1 ATP-grasp fold [Syntrophomonas zehnderi OL-4]
MRMKNILIANRGEIAIRIARAAADLGLGAVAVYSADDDRSLHRRIADRSYALTGRGAGAYLDLEQIIIAAKDTNCDAIHPGYGFLSENATFARRCAEEGLTFIGPRPDLLELFGDKTAARSFAKRCGVPLLPGSAGPVSLEEAREFFLTLGRDASVMIKATLGGGGRGMRPVYKLADLDEAYARCQSEARSAFGLGDVYIEKLIRQPRHIEVQVIGDGKQVIHLGERDCTMQRRSQKIIEVAPSKALTPQLRDKITTAALRLAQEAHFLSLGTIEFLLEGNGGDEALFAFMEVNPRLQVEHTITEEITGIDLVRAQIEIAAGKSLAELGLTDDVPRPRCYAMQLRINMETIDSTGLANPTTGTLNSYEIPSGPGIRVDGYGYNGYTNNPAFDSLLAKLIVTSRSPHYQDVVTKAYRALQEFKIEGIETNIPFLLNLLRRPEMLENNYHTRFIEENASELVSADRPVEDFSASNPSTAPEGTVALKAPVLGRIVDIAVNVGDLVTEGQIVVVMEAMKMEYEVQAEQSGYVMAVNVVQDDVVSSGDPLIFIAAADRFRHVS